MQKEHCWAAHSPLTLISLFFYFFCNTEGHTAFLKGDRTMTNLEITGYSAWSTLHQEDILMQARRMQARAAADTFGRAFKRLAHWTIETFRAVREGMKEARQ